MLRETKKKLNWSNKEDYNYLTNDPEFNCDIYIIKIADQQELQRTEVKKYGPWILTDIDQYKFMANQQELTSTLITY